MPENPPTSPIETRRTTRRFDPDRPLPNDLLDQVLTLATLAPSPMNLQPWRFLVVQEPKNRKKLRACTFGEARLTDAPVVVVVLAFLHPDRTSLNEVVDTMLDRNAIDPGSAAKLRATATREWERSGVAERTIRATMLAAGTLMLAAEGLGVASAWIDGFDDEAVREAFGIPDDHALCGLIPLGFSLEAAPFPGRLELGRVAFTEHFGLPWRSGDRAD